MQRVLYAAALSCAALQAQPGTSASPTDLFTKAPPAVDEALRAHVSQFYQGHVDGKFRVAEAVVADDTKDFFYEMEKQKFVSYEIVKVDYSENFTKAKVVTSVEIDWRSPRFGVMRVKPPIASTWKLENGQWVWYVDKTADWQSPMGNMKAGPTDPNNPTGAAVHRPTPEQIQAQIKPSKGTVNLSSFEKSQDEVLFVNPLPGEITLRVEGTFIPGLEVKLDKTTVKAGETAKLTYLYNPPTKDAKSGIVTDVHVQPTGQILSLQVKFAIPKEMEERLKRIK